MAVLQHSCLVVCDASSQRERERGIMKDHDAPPRSTIGVCEEGRRERQLEKNRKLASKRVTIDSCNMLPMLDFLTRLADSIFPLRFPFPYPAHVWFRFHLSVCGRSRSARLHLNSTWTYSPSPSPLPISALALCFLIYRGRRWGCLFRTGGWGG